MNELLGKACVHIPNRRVYRIFLRELLCEKRRAVMSVRLRLTVSPIFPSSYAQVVGESNINRGHQFHYYHLLLLSLLALVFAQNGNSELCLLCVFRRFFLSFFFIESSFLSLQQIIIIQSGINKILLSINRSINIKRIYFFPILKFINSCRCFEASLKAFCVNFVSQQVFFSAIWMADRLWISKESFH